MKSHDTCEQNGTDVISSDRQTDAALRDGFIKPLFICILMGRDKCAAGFTQVHAVCMEILCL